MKLLKSTQKKGLAQRGASLVEYAILVGLIVVICIAAVKILGQKVSQNFSTTSGTMESPA